MNAAYLFRVVTTARRENNNEGGREPARQTSVRTWRAHGVARSQLNLHLSYHRRLYAGCFQSFVEKKKKKKISSSSPLCIVLYIPRYAKQATHNAIVA